MSMTRKLSLAIAATALAASVGGPPVSAAGVSAGVLTCNVASGWGFIFGSTRDLKCTYTVGRNHIEHYVGHISRFGVDVGYIAGGVIAWGVIAPTSQVAQGALAGSYGGATAGAAAGVGGAANLLVGGSNNTISLQPLSVEGNTGVNVAAGIVALTLKAEPG